MIFNQSEVSTILYVLAFILLFVWAVKFKINYIVRYIIIIWVISAASALIFQMSSLGYRDLSILPYAFLFICFLISLYPLRYVQDASAKGVEKINPTFYRYLILAFVIVSIIPFIENLNYVLHTFGTDSQSLSDMYDNKMEGTGSEKLVTWLSPLGRLGNSVDGVFIDFLIFSFFYLLTTNIKKYYIILMFIPICNHLLFQLAMAGRGTIIMFFLISVFFILFFYKLIPSRNFSFIRNVGILIASLFVIGLLLISFSRKEAHNRDDSNIIFFGMYIGKGHLDFNEQMWNIRKTTEGDNCFSLAKKWLGKNRYSTTYFLYIYWRFIYGLTCFFIDFPFDYRSFDEAETEK